MESCQRISYFLFFCLQRLYTWCHPLLQKYLHYATLSRMEAFIVLNRYVLVFHAKTRILSNFICPRLTIARRQVGSGLTTALWSLMQDTESEGGRSTKITSMLHQWIGSCCNIRRLVYLLPFCPKPSYFLAFCRLKKIEIWLSTQNGVLKLSSLSQS